MENKTISYLNSKMRYRFIKVIYLLILFLSLVGYSVAIFVYHEPKYDNDKSYIKCANGKNFILSQNEINLYSDFMWSSDKEKAKSLCLDLDRTRSVEENGAFSNWEKIYGKTPTISFSAETENSGKYELVNIYTNRNWIATIGFILLSIIGNLLVFEAIRRVFYYIALGTIRPKNNFHGKK